MPTKIPSETGPGAHQTSTASRRERLGAQGTRQAINNAHPAVATANPAMLPFITHGPPTKTRSRHAEAKQNRFRVHPSR
jgi:hypothetical protein